MTELTDESASDDDELGRLDRWRGRAEQAADRYQKRAQTQPLLGLPLAFLARYTARQGVLLASAAAFRLFLWLLPLALLLAGVVAAVAHGKTGDVESASKTAGLTGAASQQVVTALDGAHKSWVVAVITGSILFLWATRTMMRNLTVVNAHAWAAPVPKPRQKQVLVSTLIFAGAWILVFAFAAGVHQLSKLGPGGVVLAIVLQGAAVSAVWLYLSLRLPDRRERWTDLIPGSLLLGFGLAIMNTVGRLYLPARFAHSSAMYGSLGIASVMLLWLLLIGQLIVSAALVNVVVLDYRTGRQR
ncbi:YhjD/YihY/BrkB family envelope integrity protein [Jatrophihabitans sp. DSM 45814]